MSTALPAAGTYTEYERTLVAGYTKSISAKTGAVTRKQNAFKNAQVTLTNSSDSVKIGSIITNAAGNPVKIVNQSDVKLSGEPNTITQTTNAKGGISRNYYGNEGVQIKQISNNDHGHKTERGFGEHGEQAHDYVYDENGKLIDRPTRDLSAEEQEENSDIL